MENGFGFGVCRLPVVPVMKGAGWNHPLADEMLFGEPYRITGPGSGSWLPVSCADMKLAGSADGWIHTMHHHGITDDYYSLLMASDFRVTTEATATLLFRKVQLLIVRGSLVPLSAGELFKVDEQLAFNGEAKVLTQRRDAEFLCETALKLTSIAERPGGRTPFGMDPVGWVTQCLRLAGVPAGHGLNALRKTGTLSDMANPIAGDICFMERGVDVRPGIMISGGRMVFCEGVIHAEALNGAYPSSGGDWMLVECRRVLS